MHRILSFIQGKPSFLLPFDVVRDAVDVRSTFYAGIREIDLAKVVGSVNRYRDFDREFLPTRDDSAERWANVHRTFEEGPGFAPIRVYQVGDAYFVLDGNHRVSVARQMGLKTIEAEVTVLESRVPFDGRVQADDIPVKAGYAAFLRRTHLDESRREQRIELTLPGGYAVLLEHIAVHQYYLGLRERRDVSYEEAAASWYDHLYQPLARILREEDLLRSFPGRTEADLYVWIAEHLYYLREEFGDDVRLDTAARDYVEMRRTPIWAKLVAEWEGKMRHGEGGRAPWRPLGRETRELRRVAARLDHLRRQGDDQRYRVPRRWVDPADASGDVMEASAVRFWRDAVDRVLRAPREDLPEGAGGSWTTRSTIYNLFVRSGCAFDHDGDGVIRAEGARRETGTFLKAIALLPYLRSLGCDVVHLLPIASIGADGRKGDLGSPYAIRDPYALDENLAEPLLGLGVDAEFRAFVEAAHHLGIRVVTEFVFRTAAKDAAWAEQHPEWFYWISADVHDRPAGSVDEARYGNPVFTPEELQRLRDAVAKEEYDDLVPPHASYRAMFLPVPRREDVARRKGRIEAVSPQGAKARVPGAFADWPPDDTQPPWSDVTYLRLYDHPDFNYIAYNTVRMYDARLARAEHAVVPLWDKIVGILPHYIRTFGIDGAMVDMGHALPLDLKRRIITEARAAKPDFAFWDEDFSLRRASRDEGYNAAMGSLWWTLHRAEELTQHVLPGLAREASPLPFFATPETHNTPRCASRFGGRERSRASWAVAAFLPGVPFVHGGFELGEVHPVNTGLDFPPDAAATYPAEGLPLYAARAYDWAASGDITAVLRRCLEIRAEFLDVICDPSPASLSVLSAAEGAVAYERRGDGGRVAVAANLSAAPTRVRLSGLSFGDGECIDRLGGRRVVVIGGDASLDLAPWEAIVMSERTARSS
ncbi:MAG: DUF4032 domain-containing protein [Candidatus Bipolaricaulota bacterium]